MRSHLRVLAAAGATAALVAIVACGGAATAPSQLASGQMAVSLARTTSPAVDQLWLSVARVTAHTASGGWITVSSAPVTVDLVNLQAAAQQLGLASLPSGEVSEIRLVLNPTGNRVVRGSQSFDLKVPSGAESGLKIKGPWQIGACEKTDLVLDFDGTSSIVYHQLPAGTFILRPVVRVKKADRTPVACPPPAEPPPVDPPATPPPATDPPPVTTCEAAGTCTPLGKGASCTDGPQCLSGVCTELVCMAGAPQSPCSVNEDCASAVCGPDGLCGSGAALPAGSACRADGDCLSGGCVALVCQPGQWGAPCGASTDCSEGLQCQASSCVLPN